MSTKESDVLFGDQLSGLDVSQHFPPPFDVKLFDVETLEDS
jgi:hypothetical protein